jgi:hypothetical protein
MEIESEQPPGVVTAARAERLLAYRREISP